MLFPFIYFKKCNLCGSCIHLCVSNAIVGMYNKRIIILPKDCIGCGKCKLFCSNNAIIFFKKKKIFIYTKKILAFT